MKRFELKYLTESNYIDPQGTQSWARPYATEIIIEADSYDYFANDRMIHFDSKYGGFQSRLVFAIPVSRIITLREVGEGATQ